MEYYRIYAAPREEVTHVNVEIREKFGSKLAYHLISTPY